MKRLCLARLDDAPAGGGRQRPGEVGLAAAQFSKPAKSWLVTGGGRRNPTLMKALREVLDVPVASVEDAGWDGDALEAQAFAFLAVRALEGLPLSLPAVTGARQAVPGGRVHRARG